MNIILHPGHNKCGSSSIQNFLGENNRVLMSKGFCIPDNSFRVCRQTENSNYSLGGYARRVLKCNRTKTFESDIKKIINEAALLNMHTLIISWENMVKKDLMSQSFNIHHVIKKHFREIKIIYYIRRQDDYIISLWQQAFHKLGESINETISNDYLKEEHNFFKKINYLEKIYGDQNIQVCPVNKFALKDGELIRDFCLRANLPFANVKQSFKNIGLNPYLCDILRRNPKLYADGLNDVSVLQSLSTLAENNEILFRKEAGFLKSNARNKILLEFEQENRALHQKYFPNVKFDDVFGIKKENDTNHREGNDYEIEQLKNIMALQFEMLLKLKKHSDSSVVKRNGLIEIIKAKSESIKKCMGLNFLSF